MRSIARHLPKVIEAFVILTTSSADEIDRVRGAYARFAETFPTSHAKILILDITGGVDGRTPFSVDDGRTEPPPITTKTTDEVATVKWAYEFSDDDSLDELSRER